MSNSQELVTIRNKAMMRLCLLLALLLAEFLSTGLAAAGGDEGSASTQSQTVIKKKDGLRFNVPSDWPVEERNGAVGPIPIEEYLAKKFASLESRLRVIEQQVNSYDLRLRVLEEAKKSSKPAGLLRSGEQPASTSQQ